MRSFFINFPIISKGIVLLASLILFYVIYRRLKRFKKFNHENFEPMKIDKNVSEDEKKIIEKYGYPLSIVYQDSIDNTIAIWVYKSIIINFNEDGTLRKIMD